MILAGIDEAGYGPLLGPLVVGCAAFQTDGDALGPLPCLWQRLRKLVGKRRCRTGRKIHINDSKIVYTPAVGIGSLERSILALVNAMGLPADDLIQLLEQVAPHVLHDLPAYPWYRADTEQFPLDNDATSIRLTANALRAEMQRTQTRCVHLAARIVLEGQLNRMMAATRNKSSALFSTTAIHIDYLLRVYGQSGLVIFCDRQGGREHYGSLLRLMFEDWSLEVISEIGGRSEYHLRRGSDVVRVIFSEGAERLCLSVAVASMLSKYLREALMRRFNAFWRRLLPNLEPTAGYYSDGVRFLREVARQRQELGISDDDLVRSR